MSLRCLIIPMSLRVEIIYAVGKIFKSNKLTLEFTRRWLNGTMGRCQRFGPGSIPGRRIECGMMPMQSALIPAEMSENPDEVEIFFTSFSIPLCDIFK